MASALSRQLRDVTSARTARRKRRPYDQLCRSKSPLLPQLNLSELRAEWRRLFRMQPPGLSRDLIVRGIAYRLQELAHGGLSKATVRKLARLRR